ncbi:MAG: carboxy terminal-processing peptidase, partial [Victivallaceae bacterium]
TQQLGVKPDIQLPSFTEHMEIGEEFNENHLPWDSIQPIEHKNYDPAREKDIASINKRSLERRLKNPKYEILLKNIKKFNDYKKRKEISLNEKKRWAEYLAEKKMLEANEKYIKQISGDEEDEDDGGKKADILLDEAVEILADYIDLKNSSKKIALGKKKTENKL